MLLFAAMGWPTIIALIVLVLIVGGLIAQPEQPQEQELFPFTLSIMSFAISPPTIKTKTISAIIVGHPIAANKSIVSSFLINYACAFFDLKSFLNMFISENFAGLNKK